MGEQPRRRILVAEDDESILTLFSRVLMQAGYEVSSAATLDYVQRLLGDSRFDIFVLDLSVAGRQNILAFIEKVRTQCPATLLLVISGYIPDEIASHAEAAGAELMEKPFAAPELVRRVEQMLKKDAAA